MIEENNVVEEPEVAFDPFGISAHLSEISSDAPDPAEEEHEEPQVDEVEVEAEEEHEQEEREIDEAPREKQSKGVKGRIERLATKKKELEAELEKRDAKISELQAQITPLLNLAQGLNDLKPKAEQTIEQQMQDFSAATGIKLDPYDYESDGERKLALQQARLEYDNYQRRIQDSYNQVENHVLQRIYAEQDESVRNANLGAINYLIHDRASDLVEDHGMSQQDAMLVAKREILQLGATLAQKKNKDITDVLIEKGKSKFAKRGVDENKPLQSKQKVANIDLKARERVMERAGKPNIDTVHKSSVPRPKDDFMEQMGFWKS